ncbi:hypothetical protein EDB84DRAFT_1572903 [Lactarius hengduanensis]|nr:hypothetical protein EDB84DRAFT_1572903 [Lactarius hengduanensis]
MWALNVQIILQIVVGASVQLADSVLIILMAYSINSGLLTGLLGVATTISFIVSPTSLIWLGLSWAMSKCYVNSLLAR